MEIGLLTIRANIICLQASVAQLAEFRQRIRARDESRDKRPDSQARKLLLYLFTGTRGGFTRLQIIMLLLEEPYNTHQLSQIMGLDYKAIQHHMRVLANNNMVSKISEGYGTTFCPSNLLVYNIHALDEAIERLERKMRYKKVYI